MNAHEWGSGPHGFMSGRLTRHLAFMRIPGIYGIPRRHFSTFKVRSIFMTSPLTGSVADVYCVD